jgi:hypothetical protein
VRWFDHLGQRVSTERDTVRATDAGEDLRVYAPRLTAVPCLLQPGSGRWISDDAGFHRVDTWTLFLRAGVDIKEGDRAHIAGVPHNVMFVYRPHYRGVEHHIEATLERLFILDPAPPPPAPLAREAP